jgi:hypothetical protein
VAPPAPHSSCSADCGYNHDRYGRLLRCRIISSRLTQGLRWGTVRRRAVLGAEGLLVRLAQCGCCGGARPGSPSSTPRRCGRWVDWACQPKLSPKQQAELRRALPTGHYTIADCAELFTVSRPTVCRTLQRGILQILIMLSALAFDPSRSSPRPYSGQIPTDRGRLGWRC